MRITNHSIDEHKNTSNTKTLIVRLDTKELQEITIDLDREDLELIKKIQELNPSLSLETILIRLIYLYYLIDECFQDGISSLDDIKL